MNRRSSKTSIIALLLITALVLSIWFISNFLKSEKTSKPSSNNTPDSFMANVEYTLYDKTGNWQTRFSTPHLTHFNKNDTSIITTPHMISKGEQQLTWVITADKGISNHGGKSIDLKSNVKIVRLTNDTNKTADLTTSELTAFPKEKLAKTTQPVRITQPGSEVESIGLTANLKTGDINLLSASQGVYADTAS